MTTDMEMEMEMDMEMQIDCNNGNDNDNGGGSGTPHRDNRSHSRGYQQKQKQKQKWRRVEGIVNLPCSKRVQAEQQNHMNPRFYRKRNADDEYFNDFRRQVSSVGDSEVTDDHSEEDLKESKHEQEQKQKYEGTHIQVGLNIVPLPCSVPPVDVSHKFVVAHSAYKKKEVPVETDPHKLSQRQKQIDYGKNTLGYERYLELVPKDKRLRTHPRTPDIKQVCSKRSWDGQVKKWRRRLHEFDPPANENESELPVLVTENKDLPLSLPEDEAEAEAEVHIQDDSSKSSKEVNDVDTDIYGDWEDMEQA